MGAKRESWMLCLSIMSHIWWFGFAARYNFQNSRRIALSRLWSGWLRPQSMWKRLWSTMNCIQSSKAITWNVPIYRTPGDFCNSLIGTGSWSLYCLDTLSTSLSLFFWEHRLNSKRPRLLLAASCPISLTTPCAALMAPLQLEALEWPAKVGESDLGWLIMIYINPDRSDAHISRHRLACGALRTVYVANQKSTFRGVIATGIRIPRQTNLTNVFPWNQSRVSYLPIQGKACRCHFINTCICKLKGHPSCCNGHCGLNLNDLYTT